MARKKILVNYYGWWGGCYFKPFVPDDFLRMHPYLEDKYELVLSDKPQVSLCSVYADGHVLPPEAPRGVAGIYHLIPKDSIKVLYTLEVGVPCIGMFDYYLSNSENTPDGIANDRHFNIPAWSVYLRWQSADRFRAIVKKPDESSSWDRPEFCCIVFSNYMAEFRIRFFEKLMKYKFVHCPGNLVRHGYVNTPIIRTLEGETHSESKRRYLRQFKFNICFENTSVPGYTSEKIVDAMMSRTMPIYWGDPNIGKHFNTKSFLFYPNYRDEQDLIEHIIELDNNKAKYDEMFRQPYLINDSLRPEIDDGACLSFFDRIFESI